MRKLLLLVGFHTFFLIGNAQTSNAYGEPQNYHDSLVLASSMIDNLDLTSLEYIRTNYRQLYKGNPSQLNGDVLQLLESRYKALTEDLLFHLEIAVSKPSNHSLLSYSDSLNHAKILIDDLGSTDFNRVLERYRTLNNIQPQLVNKDVLNYLEEKFRSTYHEN